jgi:hypothetical protein
MAQRWSWGVAVIFLQPWCRWGWVVHPTPRSLNPKDGDRYPFYRMLGGPQARSGWVLEISPPLEFDPQTAQPAAASSLIWVLWFDCSIVLTPVDTVTLRCKELRSWVVTTVVCIRTSLVSNLCRAWLSFCALRPTRQHLINHNVRLCLTLALLKAQFLVSGYRLLEESCWLHLQDQAV